MYFNFPLIPYEGKKTHKNIDATGRILPIAPAIEAARDITKCTIQDSEACLFIARLIRGTPMKQALREIQKGVFSKTVSNLNIFNIGVGIDTL